MNIRHVTTPYYETPNPSNMPEMPGAKCDDMSAWLDKPDGPGWWWMDWYGKEIVKVIGDKVFENGDELPINEYRGHARFQRVQPPREE